ncbi:unnamed protein product [Linum tenue]|uniref:Cytochrome P450 n=1 Tax=Linum tenue TaxID=586396 RepID=A0AAV0MR59_9ROSI|nr:unnamed protein product [Linum tenue]
MDCCSYSQTLCFPSPILATTTLLFLTLSSILILLQRRRRRESNTSAGASPPPPPGPTKLPIIGNLHQLAGSSLPHYRLRDLSTQYGSVMGLQLGQVPYVVISSAESAKQVMKAHDAVLAQRPAILSAGIISYDFSGIGFAPHGAYWRQMRKISVQELFSARRVGSFRSVREEESESANAVDRIHAAAGRVLNFSKLACSVTNGIVARVTFGKKYSGQEEFIPLIEEITKVVGGFNVADLFPALKFLPAATGMRRNLLKLRNEASRLLEAIIDDHRSCRGSRTGGGGDEVDDLVDVLLKLQANGELDFPLTDDNIKAVIMDIFTAGSDTSSTTMNWAMSEMIKNPRTLREAQAEVRRVFGPKGDVDESLLHELHYLKLVTKEALRLHTPAPLLVPRESMEDCEIGGFHVKAKSNVIVNAWAISRDPKYWNDPEEFRPERFIDSSVDFKGSNFEFLPFGAGRRMCPGLVMGMANVDLPLAKFLYHFDWKLAAGMKYEDLDMDESFGGTSTRKNNLMLIPIPYHHDNHALK